MDVTKLKILCVDDNGDILKSLEVLLTKAGYEVYTAPTPALGLSIAKKLDPDLILLDIMMPSVNGYDVCKTLQQDEQTSKIPVVFISSLGQPQNKVSALAAGGVDYLVKPFDLESLLATVKRYAPKKSAWAACLQATGPAPRPTGSCRGLCKFSDFKASIINSFNPDAVAAKNIASVQAADVYKLAVILGIPASRLARLMADFCKHAYLPVINPEEVKLGLLPVKFAAQNNITAVSAPDGSILLAISSPFNFELHEMIRGILGAEFEFCITEPANISVLYKLAEEFGQSPQKIPGGEGLFLEEAALGRLRATLKSVSNEVNEPNVKYLTGKLLQFMAEEKNSELRLEEKGSAYLVRFGPPGALVEYTRFSRMLGGTVAARLKALAGIDILERSSGKSGSFGIINRSVVCRIAAATEISACGEDLILKPAPH